MCFTSPNGLRGKIGGRAFSKHGAPLERQGTLQIRGVVEPQKGGIVSTRGALFLPKTMVFMVFGATGFGVPGKRVNPFGRQV